MRIRFDAELIAVPGLIVATVAFCAFALWLSYKEHQEWQAFSLAHSCRVSERMKGSSTVVPVISLSGSVGTAVVSSPGKTAYICNDGITYWR